MLALHPGLFWVIISGHISAADMDISVDMNVHISADIHIRRISADMDVRIETLIVRYSH